MKKSKLKRVAVVTGANRGLGLATAESLMKTGYRVICAVRTPIESSIKQKFLESNYDFLEMKVDVSDIGNLNLFCDQVLKNESAVDVLVNNAGIFLDKEEGGHESALNTKLKTIQKTFETNTLAPLVLIQKFTPIMVENNFGRIVNVSSGMGGLIDMEPFHLSYRMSKTALNVVTRTFAEEFKTKNIKINSVCPGWVKTDMGGPHAVRNIEQGIRGLVWAATLPDDGPTGGFFRDGKTITW